MAAPLDGWDRTPIMYDTLRELDHRTSDRIDVWLLWRERDNQVLVSVADEKTGDQFTIEVRDGERPLDVFNHPYAYAGASPNRREPRGPCARACGP
jgi:hypothetical protein